MTANRTDEVLAEVERWRVEHEYPTWDMVDHLIRQVELWRERAQDADTVCRTLNAEAERLVRKLADVTYYANDNHARAIRAEANLAREQAAHTQVPPGPDSTFRAWDFGRKLS